jgi:hypothetical protein
MPFTIETEVKESPIHGKGLFALEPIAKGGIVWTFHGKHKNVKGYCDCSQALDNKVWDKSSLTELYSRDVDAVKKIFFDGYVHPPSVSKTFFNLVFCVLILLYCTFTGGLIFDFCSNRMWTSRTEQTSLTTVMTQTVLFLSGLKRCIIYIFSLRRL